LAFLFIISEGEDMKEIKNCGLNSRERWKYVFLGIVIMMCLGTVYSWSVFRIPIEKSFNIGSTLSGLPYMVSLAFYALFMMLTGKVLDKFSPRFIISIGAILVAVGWLLSAYAPNIYALTITYGVVIGAGVGIAYGAPMTVVARWFPEKKGLAVGFVLIGFGLSPLVTAPLARNLIENYGIIRTFQILGISFGVIMPLLACTFKYPTGMNINVLKATSAANRYVNDIDTSKMISTNSFKSLYFNFIIGSMIGLTIVGMTSSIGVELNGLPPKTVSLLMSVFAIFNGIGRPIFGWLTDKMSSQKAMLISYTLIIIAASLMIISGKGSIVLFTIAFSIFWFNLGGWLAIAPTSTLSMYGTKHYSQNYGLVFSAYGLGAILGVLSSGLLKDALNNYNYIFYFIILMCIIGIMISQRMETNIVNKSKAS
jgi:MFS transporter, OFA family, oxalate/formate antiporter